MRSVSHKLRKFKKEFKKAVAKGVVVEEEHNDPELEAWRKEQCDGCKFQKFDEDGDETCGSCGCFLDIKRKAKTNRNKKGQVVITHCPEGFWNDEELARNGGRVE